MQRNYLHKTSWYIHQLYTTTIVYHRNVKFFYTISPCIYFCLFHISPWYTLNRGLLSSLTKCIKWKSQFIVPSENMSCRTKVRGLVILNDVSRIPLSFSFSMLLQKCLLFCFIFLDNVSQHLSLLTSQWFFYFHLCDQALNKDLTRKVKYHSIHAIINLRFTTDTKTSYATFMI